MKKSLLTAILCCFAIAASYAQGSQKVFADGPWVVADDTSFTVLCRTAVKSLVCVEVAPDDGTAIETMSRPRYYQTVGGRRYADTFHSIRVGGLEPGKTYRYRLYARTIADDSSFRDVHYGTMQRYAKEPFYIRTLDPKAATCRFSVVNDIHSNDKLYAELMAPVDPKKADFMVVNGDHVSAIGKIDTLVKHLVRPIVNLTSNLPMVYVRGNHEGRGPEAHLAPKVFAISNGNFYYMFRQGPVAILVLDGGEDKPDDSNEYSGQADYDTYRAEELAWLREVVKDPLFTEAPFRVALCHMPPAGKPTTWHGMKWLHDKFTPVLNEAGVDLMLSGHSHRHYIEEKGTYNNNFPIFVNDNTDRLDFEATSDAIRIRTFDASGAQTHSFDIKK